MARVSVRLPDSLHRGLKELALREGVPMSHIIATAVAEKMSALMTADYLAERAARGSRDRFEAVLAKVRDVELEERDRLE